MDDILIYGAGNLGRYINNRLKSTRLTPRAFIDNNKELQGQIVDGLTVYSPEQWLIQHGDMDIRCALAIWNPAVNLVHLRNTLKSMGFKIECFTDLFAQFPDVFLPYYCFDFARHIDENIELIVRVSKIWEDDKSTELFNEWVAFLNKPDFKNLSSPLSSDCQYFADFVTWIDNEVIIDCGAYIGDTLESFIDKGISIERYIAIEPSAESFKKMQENIHKMPLCMQKKIVSIYAGVGEKRKWSEIGNSGLAGATLFESQNGSIKVIPIDEVAKKYGWPTVIKMDIEGAELNALRGASGCLNRRPMLEISLYHRQSDIWTIPTLVNDRWGDTYAHFLRRYGENGFELIYYGIPRERMQQRIMYEKVGESHD